MVEIKFKSGKEIFEEQEEKENKIIELEGQKPRKKELGCIMKVMRRYSPEELKDLTRQEFKETKGSSNFWIGTKDKIEGQITFLEEEQRQKFVLIRVVKKTDRDTGEVYFKHYFFDEPLPSKDRGLVWDTLEEEFYLYKFKTKEKTYQLFSYDKLGLGEYNVWGTIIEILDYVDLGNYTRIGLKQPLLFVHSAFEKKNVIQTHKEFFERFEKYKLTEKKFIDWLYTSPQGWTYEFPKSFCYIQIANLFSCADDFNSFHLPVLMIGETGTGKTTGAELIFNKMHEIQEYTDMTSSTLKGLIPSFKNQMDLKPGLFLEARRYVPVDEFFPGMSNLHPEEKQKVMENIKNILDYKERAHRSGHGKIKGKMRAEHIALTNSKGYGDNLLQLSNHFFPENLTRYLIWYIPNSQRDFIEKKKSNLNRGEYSYIAKQDFLEGIDYLKSFNCKYDIEKVQEIYKIGKTFLFNKGAEYHKVKAIYSSRYDIHIIRLLDSLVKLRCWVEGDKSFKAKAEDYKLVGELWLEMLENWGIGFLIVDYRKIE